MNSSLGPGGLGRGAMNGGVTIQMMIQQYGQKLQSWIPEGWQKELVVGERLNILMQL